MTQRQQEIINNILEENRIRNERIRSEYNQLLGIGCLGSRYRFAIPDFVLPEIFINEQVRNTPLIRAIAKAGTITDFIIRRLNADPTPETIDEVEKWILRVLIKEDFEFCAAYLFIIKDKLSENNIPFRLNRPQRRLLSKLEGMRLAGKPIRLILLKARQWGGSTLVQMYIAWIQLFHKTNWNSITVAHIKDTSYEIKGMYSLLLANMPSWVFEDGIPVEFKPFEGSQSISIIPSRKCKIKLGSAETPNSARGGDTAMAHLTEVGLWKKTDGKTPEDVIRGACSGISLIPYSLKVYESTANGTGNFFHKEWLRAKRKKSDMVPMFVPWFEIEMYADHTIDEKEMAISIYIKPEDKETSEYEQYLFSIGATLQAIAWYREKRKEYADHGDMKAEFPSDDVEAFQNSGSKVFKPHLLEKMRANCRKPDFIGYLTSKGPNGKDATKEIQFVQEEGFKSFLKVWEMPDYTPVRDRYIVIVDIGGRSTKADFSVITVIDRYWMMYGGAPEVVARWYGHTDHDLLVWEAVRIAQWYNEALLVFESNTLETENTDGDHTEFILDTVKNDYDNLYSRTPADKIKEGAPVKYGFHTNRSTKTMIIDEMIKSHREGTFIERDDMAINEGLNFEKKQNGTFGAIDNEHDDIWMTDMIGNYIAFELPTPKIIERTAPITKKIISDFTF